MPNAFRLWTEFRFLYRAWRYRWKVERAEIGYVLQNLTRGATCLDIGGHKGAFTYWMQRCVGPSGRVFTFEPQPELARYLEAKRASLGLENVTIVNAAVSSTPGERELFRDTEVPTPSATLERPENVEGFTDRVRTESLDDYFADSPHRPIRFIKCDVEGHELDVFQGATNILDVDRPTILFECEQRHQATPITRIFDFLSERGYQGEYFQHGELKDLSGFQPDRNVHGEPGYVYNFVFRPGEETGLKSGRRMHRAA